MSKGGAPPPHTLAFHNGCWALAHGPFLALVSLTLYFFRVCRCTPLQPHLPHRENGVGERSGAAHSMLVGLFPLHLVLPPLFCAFPLPPSLRLWVALCCLHAIGSALLAHFTHAYPPTHAQRLLPTASLVALRICSLPSSSPLGPAPPFPRSRYKGSSLDGFNPVKSVVTRLSSSHSSVVPQA